MRPSAPSPIAFTGGPILTMDPAAQHPDVVVVDGGRIVAVGPAALLDGWPGAARHDLAGRTLAPGLIDAHNHLSVAALHPRWHDVTGARDRDDLVRIARAAARAEPEAAWLRLRGWNETVHGFSPTRTDLDAAGLDRPIVVTHYSLHQAVVSSAALDVLGIGRSTPDPPGGEIGRDGHGVPNGLLLERAWSEAHATSLRAYADPDRWAEHLAARARALHAEGITCVHDAACSPEAEAVYRSMASEGMLPVSVVGLPHAAALLSNELGDRLEGAPTGEGDERFRVGPAKLFADGGIAIAIDATIRGEPIVYGMVMADLAEQAERAVDHGFGLAIHAIGNAGVDAALGAFANLADRVGDRGLRLEHAGLTGPRHWARVAELGVIAVVQPGFVEHIGMQSGGFELDDLHWLGFGGLAEAGATLAASSDDPCAPVPPMWCAHRGEARTTTSGVTLGADQSVPFDDWLRAYTVGAASAGGQSAERGSLTVGKRADLVVLDRSCDPPVVAETWFEGTRVFP